MHHRSVLLQLLALVGVALLLAACSSQSAPASQSSQPAPAGGAQSTTNAPKRGGMLVRSAGNSSYGASDPHMGQQSYNVWPILSEYVLRRHPDTWEIQPAAIEKWEYSADGKTLTLHVRKGMKLHNKPPYNGREVEAKDIIYTLKGYTGQLYPQLPALRFPRRSNLEQMVDAVEVDKYTVKVTLTEASATFLDGLAEYRSPMIPDQLRENFGGLEALATPDVARFISAGPFVLKTFVQQTEATYERNPDYWDIGADGKAKPYLDGIKEIWIADQGTTIAAFIAGQIDYLAASSGGAEQRDLIMAQRQDVQLISYPPDSCFYRLAYNMGRKPFDDFRVRKAISLVVDKARLGQELRGEWNGQALWVLPAPLPWVFPESLPQEELAKIDLYQGPTPQNVAEAKRLLDEAGLGNGFEFVMMGALTPVRKAEAQLIIDDINKSFGGKVRVKLELVDNAINQERAIKGDFDVQIYCYIHEATGVAMMKTAYHSQGGRNFARFSDQKMDDLLDQASRELDTAKRIALMHQAQYRVFETLSMMPTYHGKGEMVVQPYVRGLQLGAATSYRSLYKEVWLDK